MSQLMSLWRLCNGTDFWGGNRGGGRWHPSDQDVIVLDSTPIAALCAALVATEVAHPRALPANYHLHEVRIPTKAIQPVQAPRRWRDEPKQTRSLGQKWLNARQSLVLCVPTIQGGEQYLLNASHRDVDQCQLVTCKPYPFDDSVAQLQAMLGIDAEWLAVLDMSGHEPESKVGAG